MDHHRLSDAQIKTLRILAKSCGSRSFGGPYGIRYLSAARALVKKGLASAGHMTGTFFITDKGRDYLRTLDAGPTEEATP